MITYHLHPALEPKNTSNEYDIRIHNLSVFGWSLASLPKCLANYGNNNF